MKKNVLNHTQVGNRERVVDEGGREAATFNGQWTKVKEEELEWRLKSGKSKIKGK
jgi:hypothetical protein